MYPRKGNLGEVSEIWASNFGHASRSWQHEPLMIPACCNICWLETIQISDCGEPDMLEACHFKEHICTHYQACLCILIFKWQSHGAYFQIWTIIFFIITEFSYGRSCCHHFELIRQGSNLLSFNVARKASQYLIWELSKLIWITIQISFEVSFISLF